MLAHTVFQGKSLSGTMESKPTKTHPWPKLTFMNARLDGHMVAAISRRGGEPTLDEPTAVVADYPPALPSYGVTNAKTLCYRLKGNGLGMASEP